VLTGVLRQTDPLPLSTEVDKQTTSMYTVHMAIDTTNEICGETISPSELIGVGGRLRSFRLMRGWTLDTLASRVKLSKSYLSRLEDGDRQPSVAALLSISRALGVSLGTLLSDEPQTRTVRVVRGAELPAVQGNGLVYQIHSGGSPGAAMQRLRITIPAGRTGNELYRHDGEEWLYVLSGKLTLVLGDKTYALGAGDSIYFDATIGHRLTADGERDVEAILVASMTPQALLTSYM
jgi:transcriptional regulator with XRE-family HTH domain